jgi:cardiolipin-specific phospholipase
MPAPDYRAATPPPAAKPIPADFKSSLSAWWNNASYREARLAEERLLRRMEIFRPSPPAEQVKGWFGWSTSQSVVEPTPAEIKDHHDSAHVENRGQLVATLRNVFIKTPNPDDAPKHPVDPIERTDDGAGSPGSSTASLGGTKCKTLKKKTKEEKMVDYINTMEISTANNRNSKEAVVVLHGYAAAMG